MDKDTDIKKLTYYKKFWTVSPQSNIKIFYSSTTQ